MEGGTLPFACLPSRFSNPDSSPDSSRMELGLGSSGGGVGGGGGQRGRMREQPYCQLLVSNLSSLRWGRGGEGEDVMPGFGL